MDLASLAHQWADLPLDRPMDRLERRRLMGQQAMISHVTLRQGCDVPSHRHENEQFACVLSGRLRFTLGEPGAPGARVVEVGPGGVIHLPANLSHAALALEETVVLDVFSPPSAMTGIDRGGR